MENVGTQMRSLHTAYVIEPTTTSAIGGIILGAVGKKIVDETWDVGRNWLAGYFKNCQPKTLAIAEQRASDFLNRLAGKVERLEEQQGYDHSVIERAMIDPAFGTLLHRALIHSAETSSETAHTVLANLVAERLATEAETTKAVTLLSATEAAANLTTAHFTALACFAVQRYGSPLFDPEPADESDFLAVCSRRAETLLAPFSHVEITETDMRYLIATSCGVHNSISLGDRFVHKWAFGQWKLKLKSFQQFPPMSELGDRWSHRLWFFEATTVGDIIGLAALEATGVREVGIHSWK